MTVPKQISFLGLTLLSVLIGLQVSCSKAPTGQRDAHAILVYVHAGEWVFDDLRHGVARAELLSGTAQLMDVLVERLEGPQDRFRILIHLEDPGNDRALAVEYKDERNGFFCYRSEVADAHICLSSDALAPFSSPPAMLYMEAVQ